MTKIIILRLTCTFNVGRHVKTQKLITKKMKQYLRVLFINWFSPTDVSIHL